MVRWKESSSMPRNVSTVLGPSILLGAVGTLRASSKGVTVASALGQLLGDSTNKKSSR